MGTGCHGSRSPYPYSDSWTSPLASTGNILLSRTWWYPVDVPLGMRLVVLAPLVAAAILGVLRYRLPTTVLGVAVAATSTALPTQQRGRLSTTSTLAFCPPCSCPARSCISTASPRVLSSLGFNGFFCEACTITVVGAMALIAPGVASYLHSARSNIPARLPGQLRRLAMAL